jgi:hypothetical protein
MACFDIEFNEVFNATRVKCKFKNCRKRITEGPSNKIYCSKPCKNKDQVYKSRIKKKKGRPKGALTKLGDTIKIYKDLTIDTTKFILNI